MKLKKILQLIDKALATRDNPDMDWGEKYNVIFNMKIREKIRKSGIFIPYHWKRPGITSKENVLTCCATLENFKRRYGV